jgi:hypothetical protein
MTEAQMLATGAAAWIAIVLYGLFSGKRGRLRNPLKRMED